MTFKLTDDQNRIVNNIINSEKKVHYLKGRAGVGKTVVASNLTSHFKRPIIIAPTAQALTVSKSKFQNAGNVVFKTFASVAKGVSKYLVSNKGLEFNLESESEVDKLKSFLKAMKINPDEAINKVFVSKGKESTYIVNVDKLNEDLKKMGFKFDIETRFPLLDDVSANLINPQGFHYDLILVDETSMISKEDADVLIKFVNGIEGEKIKLVFAGDHKQLPEIEGQPFADFVLDEENVLTEILRSDDEVIKVANIVREKPILAVKDHITFVKDIDDLTSSHQDLIKESDILLTYTNKDVNDLNYALRDKSNARGFVVEGEPLVVTQNAGYYNKSILFNNSERIFVEKIYSIKETYDDIIGVFDHEGVSDHEEDDRLLHLSRLVENGDLRKVKVRKENGGSVLEAYTSLNLASSYIKKYDMEIIRAISKTLSAYNPALTFVQYKLAYAMTVHKSQGSEWDNVLYVFRLNRRNQKINNNLDYTAITRAKKQIKIVGLMS